MIKLRTIFFSFLIAISAAGVSVSQGNETVFAISPMASPVSTFSSYGDFIKYLSEQTGIELVLKQRRKYSEINSLLKSGEAQFALTCTGAYLSGRQEFNLEVLAIPVVNGKTSYNSYILVNKESNIEDISGLQGKIFAFTDPLSLTGRLYPLYLLYEMGVKEDEFFRKTFYTSSHEKSIGSVANGVADGAAVDSLIFDDMKRKQNPAIEKVKIIKISPSYGIPPIVSSPETDKSTKQIFLKALIKMGDNPEGKAVLEELGIDRFIIPNPAVYHEAAKLKQTVLQ